MEIYVIKDSYSNEWYESDSPYSDWEITHSFSGFAINTKQPRDSNNYSIETSCFDISPGDIVYLVYVNYNSGNSFGQEEGITTYLDVFKTPEKAFAAANKINKEKIAEIDGFDKESYHFKYMNENDQEVSIYAFWRGYFEHLNGAYVQRILAT